MSASGVMERLQLVAGGADYDEDDSILGTEPYITNHGLAFPFLQEGTSTAGWTKWLTTTFLAMPQKALRLIWAQWQNEGHAVGWAEYRLWVAPFAESDYLGTITMHQMDFEIQIPAFPPSSVSILPVDVDISTLFTSPGVAFTHVIFHVERLRYDGIHDPDIQTDLVLFNGRTLNPAEIAAASPIPPWTGT